MLTTMEDEVLELWTSSVTSTPITRPARGLESTALSWKISPAVFPNGIYSRKEAIMSVNRIGTTLSLALADSHKNMDEVSWDLDKPKYRFLYMYVQK